MNAMVYLCGVDKDFNDWAALGNPGWDHESILPFIKKSEGNTNRTIVDYSKGKFHSTKGPLTVSNYYIDDSFLPILQQAVNQAGFRQRMDFNAKEYNGFSLVQGTIGNGERSTSAKAFLVPARNRPNLFVMKESLVTKLTFENSARGIEVTGINIKTERSDCPNIVATATRETILSAGALGSPKILLQSGIGKLEDLQPFGISQVKDLPVGDNYQDHLYIASFVIGRPGSKATSLVDLLSNGLTYLLSKNDRQGAFSSLGVFGYVGFINTQDQSSRYPNIQYHFLRFDRQQQAFTDFITKLGFKDEFVAQLETISQTNEVLMIATILAKPKSKGTVKLRSRDPSAAPKITSNFLSHPEDRRTLLAGYRNLQKILNTSVMKASGVEFIRVKISECDPLVYDSDDYVNCYLRYFTSIIWHPSCTVKMGPASDPTAVVDERLRVKGIRKLRVADASIMPEIVTSNLQCTVYAIGEKAAGMIKADNA